MVLDDGVKSYELLDEKQALMVVLDRGATGHEELSMGPVRLKRDDMRIGGEYVGAADAFAISTPPPTSWRRLRRAEQWAKQW